MTHPPCFPANHPTCRIFLPTNIRPRNYCTAGVKFGPSWIVFPYSKAIPKSSYSAEPGNPRSVHVEILGPLSKRREVSRGYVIQASTSLGNHVETANVEQTDAGGVQQRTPLLVRFQGTAILRDLDYIVSLNPNLQKWATNSASNTPSTSAVNHFIRYQHRKLVGQIPILTYSEHLNSPVGKHQVSLSTLTNLDSSNRLTSVAPVADGTGLAWLRLAPRKNPR